MDTQSAYCPECGRGAPLTYEFQEDYAWARIECLRGHTTDAYGKEHVRELLNEDWVE